MIEMTAYDPQSLEPIATTEIANAADMPAALDSVVAIALGEGIQLSYVLLGNYGVMFEDNATETHYLGSRALVYETETLETVYIVAAAA